MTVYYNKLTENLVDQIPDYVQDLYPMFVTFVTAYYKWLEEPGNPQDIIQGITLNRDIDTTASSLATKFVSQYIPDFPQEALADRTILIKYFRDFYERKGSEASFKFFFRAFFGDEIEISRPPDYMFATSDANWYIENYLEVTPVSGNPLKLTNTIITGDTTGAHAAVNKVTYVNTVNGNFYHVILDKDSWVGTFSSSETITGYSWDFTAKPHTSSEVVIQNTKPQQVLPGVWTDTKSQLSDNQILQDSHYFQRFSYIIRSRVGLDKWKSALLKQLHPAGTAFFNDLILDDISIDPKASSSSFAVVTLAETSVKIPTAKDFYIAPGYSFDRLATYRTGTSATTTARTVVYDANYVYPGENVTWALQYSGDDGTRPAVVVGGPTFDKIGTGVANVNQMIAMPTNVNSSVVNIAYITSVATLTAPYTLYSTSYAKVSAATSVLLVITSVKDPLPTNATNEAGNRLYISISSNTTAITVKYSEETQRNYKSLAAALPYAKLIYYHDNTVLTADSSYSQTVSSTAARGFVFNPLNENKSQSYSRIVFEIDCDSTAETTLNYSVSVSSSATFNSVDGDFLSVAVIG
jgi:hypothetical protein